MEEEKEIKRVLVIARFESGISIEKATAETMTVGQLKEIINSVPDDTKIIVDIDTWKPFNYATIQPSTITEEVLI